MLFVWSAADKEGISRISQAYQGWDSPITDDGSFLSNLAYTLDSHRSHLPWRSFALLKSSAELKELQNLLSSPVQASPKAPRLGFVFSGQGAQWFAMGRELSSYLSYGAELDRADKYLRSIGCPWSVTGKRPRPFLIGLSSRTDADQKKTNCKNQRRRRGSTSPNSARPFAPSCK